MTNEEWTWAFTRRAADRFQGLDGPVQEQIVTKLDAIVTSEWRDPDDFLESLTGGPFQKLRIGAYRLACVLDRTERVLEVHRIEHRNGAYTADD